MNIYSYKLVLKTVVLNWFYIVFIIILHSFVLLFLLITFCFLLKSAFSAHYVVIAVRSQIKHFWELEKRIYFIISEGIKVKDKSLVVHNQYVWGFCNQSAF